MQSQAAGMTGAPTRFEADIADCEVQGQIPHDIDGAFYRVGAEWYYPPKFADDGIVNADGYISMFRIRGGRVSYKGRWVRTERFRNNQEAGRQLYGYYRNPFTDDPYVRDAANPARRTVANTAPVIHARRLLALKEDGLPYELDPNTLETRGQWDAAGGWRSQTFTAHPKIDPLTGEMVSFGYEATGLASDDLYIATLNAQGRVTDSVTVKVPYVSVIHDMALTHRHVVIPFGGYVTSLQRLRDGRIHWGWDASKPSMIGVIPRGGSARDMRWFEGPERCMMHTFNAHTEGDKVILHAPFYDSNFFPFFPNVDGSPFNPAKARALIRRITLDLSGRSSKWEEEILWPMPINDLGKVDPRVLTLETRYLYMPFVDDARLPTDPSRLPAGTPARLTNTYGRFDLRTQQVERYFAGPTHSLQECTFVPRETGIEGDGYLIGVCTNYAEQRAELVVADAQRLGEGDVARVILPFRISAQVHGIWASSRELPLV
ncbi:MAG: carotenoid oxygenase family protein [Pseudomonadota bacterium]|nr:carotenoid oxygenase family protein [Pseudomonadota bacterium]